MEPAEKLVELVIIIRRKRSCVLLAVGNDKEPGLRQGAFLHLLDNESQEHRIITPK
jgi:hypothetical protein